jgi:hypothetical protein
MGPKYKPILKGCAAYHRDKGRHGGDFCHAHFSVRLLWITAWFLVHIAVAEADLLEGLHTKVEVEGISDKVAETRSDALPLEWTYYEVAGNGIVLDACKIVFKPISPPISSGPIPVRISPLGYEDAPAGVVHSAWKNIDFERREIDLDRTKNGSPPNDSDERYRDKWVRGFREDIQIHKPGRTCLPNQKSESLV